MVMATGIVSIACNLLGLHSLGMLVFNVILLISIIALARLLTLAFRASSHAIAEYGTKALGPTAFNRYWERVVRLLPFTERCFEAAVYIFACFQIVSLLSRIDGPERGFGNRLVEHRSLTVKVTPEQAFVPIQLIGGDTGWYYGNWPWRLRGFLDYLFGGVGLRRGRRDPDPGFGRAGDHRSPARRAPGTACLAPRGRRRR
jgi:hypothetical protein